MGVPVSEAEEGATPGSLRGSGATWFYQQTEDVARTGWRGRWSSNKQLARYLQDVSGQLLLVRMSAERRDTLKQFADSCAPLLRREFLVADIRPR